MLTLLPPTLAHNTKLFSSPVIPASYAGVCVHMSNCSLGDAAPITFSAARGASIQLFTTVLLHTVAVVVLQASDVPLWVLGESTWKSENVQMP